MQRVLYRLRPNRVVPAMLAGVATGAGVTSLSAAAIPPMMPIVFAFALIPWALGVFLLGGPVWMALHRFGERGGEAPVLAGAGLIAIPGGAILMATGGGLGIGGLVVLGLLTLVGAGVGLVIWNIAYGPAPTVDADDAEVFQ